MAPHPVRGVTRRIRRERRARDHRAATARRLRPTRSRRSRRDRHALPDRAEFHAVSDPHEPPDAINDRARDVVDLLLLRNLTASSGNPTLAEIRQAAMAVFAARTDEAAQLGLATRDWPPTLVAHPHWVDDFARAATSGGVGLSLDEAAAEVNAWIKQVELGGLIDEEARMAEHAEATSDPGERLPPHVKVTRGRSPRPDRD